MGFESRYKPISYGIKQTAVYIDKRSKGLIPSGNTGIPSLNNAMLEGLEYGTITTIVGGSSSGKSTFVESILHSILDNDPNVEALMFQFDMAISQSIMRYVAKQTSLTMKQLKSVTGHKMTKEERELADDTLKLLAKKPISYIDASITSDEIKEEIMMYVTERELIENNKRLVLLIDYAALVKEKKGEGSKVVLDNLCLALIDIKKTLIDLGLDCVILLLSQSNRNSLAADAIKDPRLQLPDPSWIYGSSSLMNCSDNLIYLMNPSKVKGITVYGPSNLPIRQNVTGFPYIYATFLKNRNDDLATLQLVANFKRYSIYDATY